MTATFAGKTAIVTGAGTGVGRALAEELASQGAIVYVTAMTLKEAKPVAKNIAENGGTAYAAKCDVTVDADLKRVINKAVKEQGQLDLMVNNAGIVFVGEFFEMNEAQIRKITDVNYNAVQIGMLYAYKQMKKQGFGQILNIASMGGLVPTPTMVSYAGTKFGVVGLTYSLATEAEAYGVDLRAACMGNIRSELITSGESGRVESGEILKILPKVIEPEAAARTIVKGLTQNSRLIFTPFYAKLSWYIMRLSPKMLFKGSQDIMEKFRRL
ncbi:MAG: SDR family NAD(P)-dependent oxidoreductase [Parvibaculales bacterium]